MKKFFNKVQSKANELAIRAKSTIDNARAEGYIDTGVKIIIGVVVGAVMPWLQEKIKRECSSGIPRF